MDQPTTTPLLPSSSFTSLTPPLDPTTPPLDPPHMAVGDIPNYYNYTSSLWCVKVTLPLSLLLQSIGHVIILKVYITQKTKCDSLLLLLNYLISDTILLVYTVFLFSYTSSSTGSCVPLQIVYNIAITLPIYAVVLLTFKRFIRVTKPLHCSYIVTKIREVLLVIVSWIVIIGTSLLTLLDLCNLMINSEIGYCYFTADDKDNCWVLLALQIIMYFVVPIVSVLVMYGVMLRESRRAFQREALVSFIQLNRTSNYTIGSPGSISGIPPSQDLVVKNMSFKELRRDDVPLEDLEVEEGVVKAPWCTTKTVSFKETNCDSDNVTEIDIKCDTDHVTDDVTKCSGVLGPETPTTSEDRSSDSGSSRTSSKDHTDLQRQMKRVNKAKKVSIHGTICVMLGCYLIRSLPWLPQILYPDLYLPENDNIVVVEVLALLQCLGIATCPYIFILTTTTNIKQGLTRLFLRVSEQFYRQVLPRVTPSPA